MSISSGSPRKLLSGVTYKRIRREVKVAQLCPTLCNPMDFKRKSWQIATPTPLTLSRIILSYVPQSISKIQN